VLTAGILLHLTHLFCQEAEHPLLRPNSYGTNFDGPALALECVALLKADTAGFVAKVRAKSPAERRKCVNELVQSLTPEPEFTAKDFETAILADPDHNLSPSDPNLAARMGSRLGVNTNVGGAIAQLARDGLIDDPGVIQPLIRCLNYPLWAVAQNCHDSLFYLTWHTYGGWGFFPNESSTQEQRARIIGDWTAWESRLRDGHPFMDGWLKSEILKTMPELGVRLEAALKDGSRPTGGDWSRGVASSYIDASLVRNPRLLGLEPVFEFVVGDHSVDNWPAARVGRSIAVEAVGVRIFRPGIDPMAAMGTGETVSVSSGPEGDIFDDSSGVYTEVFPALDLTVQVAIRTSDDRLRKAYLSVVRDGLEELRTAELEAASRQ